MEVWTILYWGLKNGFPFSVFSDHGGYIQPKPFPRAQILFPHASWQRHLHFRYLKFHVSKTETLMTKGLESDCPASSPSCTNASDRTWTFLSHNFSIISTTCVPKFDLSKPQFYNNNNNYNLAHMTPFGMLIISIINFTQRCYFLLSVNGPSSSSPRNLDITLFFLSRHPYQISHQIL